MNTPACFVRNFSIIFQFLSLISTTAGSEQMSLVQLFVPAEVAHDTVAELGELGNVQFKDVSYAEILNLRLQHIQPHTRHF